MSYEKQQFEFMEIVVTGEKLHFIADALAKNINFEGTYKTVNYTSNKLCFRGWCKRIDAEYFIQCIVPLFKGLEGNIVEPEQPEINQGNRVKITDIEHALNGRTGVAILVGQKVLTVSLDSDFAQVTLDKNQVTKI